MNEISGIYMIKNKINGKKYIGLSNNIKRRFQEHVTPKNIEKKLSISRAIKKYGKDNFDFIILEKCEINELENKEIEYIKNLKPEYNRAKGGSGSKGHKLSDDFKEHLRKKGKEQWIKKTKKEKEIQIKHNLKGPKKGHIVSMDTREKLRKANLGKKQTKETIEKRKKSFSNIVFKRTPAFKKVFCPELNLEFNSVKDAAKHIGVHPSSITSVLKKRQKTSKGKTFVYSSVETSRDEFSGVGRKMSCRSKCVASL